MTCQEADGQIIILSVWMLQCSNTCIHSMSNYIPVLRCEEPFEIGD